MDVNAILAYIGTLASGVSGATEVWKALLTKYAPDLDADTRKVVVLIFAALAGVVAAAIADFNLPLMLFPTTPIDPRIGIVLSGIALVLPADWIRAILELTKSTRDHQAAKADSVDSNTQLERAATARYAEFTATTLTPPNDAVISGQA